MTFPRPGRGSGLVWAGELIADSVEIPLLSGFTHTHTRAHIQTMPCFSQAIIAVITRDRIFRGPILLESDS